MNLIDIKKEFEIFLKKFKTENEIFLLMEFLDLTVDEYRKDQLNILSRCYFFLCLHSA